MFPSREILAIAVMGSFVVCANPGHADVKISTKATSEMSCSGGVCSPTAKNAILNVTDLANMLASGDVTVTSGSLAQDIEMGAALTWTSTHRLTLDSYHSIAFNQPLTVAGAGALTITTNDGGSGGDFSFSRKGSVKFWDIEGDLAINGKDYRLIESLKDLVREFRHGGGLGHYFAQMKNWRAKKTYTTAPIESLDGTFEGLGNSISHLTIRDSSTGNVAFVGSIGATGTVRDVRLTAVDIAGTDTGSGQRIAALTAAGGTIMNCHVDGQISATGPDAEVGGLLASGGGTVIRSSAHVMISANGAAYSGGLIGHSITGGRHPLNAFTPALVQESYSTGAISAKGASGGLVGFMDGNGTVSSSFSFSSVTASNGPAGGLIAIRSGSLPVVTSAYSTGAVSSGAGAPVGGSIGEDDVAGSGIANDYWDLDTSGISDPAQGAGNVPNDPGITGLTDAQLKSALPAGFDPKIWAINPKINNGYPYLINNPPPK